MPLANIGSDRQGRLRFITCMRPGLHTFLYWGFESENYRVLIMNSPMTYIFRCLCKKHGVFTSIIATRRIRRSLGLCSVRSRVCVCAQRERTNTHTRSLRKKSCGRRPHPSLSPTPPVFTRRRHHGNARATGPSRCCRRPPAGRRCREEAAHRPHPRRQEIRRHCRLGECVVDSWSMLMAWCDLLGVQYD